MTNRAVENMQRNLELLINQLISDVEVTRTVLQVIAMQVFDTMPDPVRGLEQLKAAVMANLPVQASGQDPQDSERKRQLLLHGVAEFFSPLEAALRGTATTSNQRTQ
jgi:hypothetical protein